MSSSLRLHIVLLLVALSLAVSCSDDDPTYKPDTTPPAILTGPTVSDITSSTATVSWTTDDLSTSMVLTTTDSTFWWGNGVQDARLVREHTIVLGPDTNAYGGEIMAPTLIYFHVGSRNASGLTTWSQTDTFTALP